MGTNCHHYAYNPELSSTRRVQTQDGLHTFDSADEKCQSNFYVVRLFIVWDSVLLLNILLEEKYGFGQSFYFIFGTRIVKGLKVAKKCSFRV